MNQNVENATRRIGLALLLGALACCDPNTEEEFLWLETFEDVCDDGLPCGWQRVDGSPDDVRYVSTSFHPGEHGIRLTGPATVRGPGSDGRAANFTLGSLEARFIARCDAGSSIEIVVGLRETTVSGMPSGRTDMTLPARVYPAPTWSTTPETTIITSESAFVDGGLGPPVQGELEITSVLLSKTGPGSCEVAELIIDDVGASTRMVSDGC